jgi:hypothetical protein
MLRIAGRADTEEVCDNGERIRGDEPGGVEGGVKNEAEPDVDKRRRVLLLLKSMPDPDIDIDTGATSPGTGVHASCRRSGPMPTAHNEKMGGTLRVGHIAILHYINARCWRLCG